MRTGIRSVSLKWVHEEFGPKGWPPLEQMHFLLDPVPVKWDQIYIEYNGWKIQVEVMRVEHDLTPSTLEKDPSQHVTLLVQPIIL